MGGKNEMGKGNKSEETERKRERGREGEREIEAEVRGQLRSLIPRTWSNELMENPVHTRGAAEYPRFRALYAPLIDDDHHFERRDAPATTDDGRDSPARDGWLKALAVTASRLRRKRV